MAGPNQPGDTDKTEEERLRDDDISLTSDQENQESTNEQETTLPATEATVSNTVIADSDSDLDKEFKREQEQIQEEITVAAQDAERSVMVGRDANNIGENATSNAVLNAVEAASTGPDAQDIENDAHKNETVYGFGADAAAKQMNDALSGAGEGKTNTTFTARTQEAERKRREEDSLSNIRTIAMTAEVAAAYAALEEAYKEMGVEMTDLCCIFEEIDAQASEMIEALGVDAQDIEKEIATLKQELQDLKDGTSLLGTDDDPAVTAAQIALKNSEIKSAEARLTLIKETISSTKGQIQETKDQIATAQEKYDNLAEQKRIAQMTGDPNKNLAGIQKHMDIAQKEIQAAKDSINDLKDKVKLTESISKIVGSIEVKSQTCGTLEVELAKAERINAGTELIKTLTSATQDGNINETELAAIKDGMNAAGVSQEAKNEFIASFAATNGTITISDPSSPTGEKVLQGDDLTAHLQSQWTEIKEEQKEAKDAAVDHKAVGDTLRLELAALEAKTGQLQSDVTKAEETVTQEQQESDAATAGVAEIKEITLKYDSVYDYMSENYSVTVGYGYLSTDVGKGENIDDVANDPNRALRDQGGNLVYVNPDTQRMYTLQKDENGDVARDTDGNQIPVAVSSLETIQLYQKMYDEKLLPRNFFKDEGGVYKEHSESDSFTESIGKSLLPGFMDKNQREALLKEAAAEEQQQAAAAKITAGEAKTNLDTAQNNLNSKENVLNIHNVKTEDIRTRIEAADQAYAQFKEKHAAKVEEFKGNDAAEFEKFKEQNTSTETTAKTDGAAETATDTQRGNSEEHKYDTPDHNLDTAAESRNDALKEVELAVLNGTSLSQEDYNRLKDTVGMSAGQLDDMLDNNPSAKVENNTQAPSNTMTVQQFGTVYARIPIPTSGAPAPDQNGVSPAIKYESFADSKAFSSTNDPKAPAGSYDAVAIKQGDNPPAASIMFSEALAGKPDESDTGIPKIEGMTPQQAEQLMREENQRQQLAAAALAAQGGGGGAGAV
ncbi:MAG: hypothetical protein COA45_01620 [Zetaproteobacteria bacterium]|nr:MAG: hypothetical protein COA45_01620 [Zetaproteobacteria bacterium]